MRHSLFVKLIFLITMFLRTKYLSSLRSMLWRLAGVKVGKDCNIEPGVEFIAGEISIGDGTFIGTGTKITGGKIVIGQKCDIAPWSIIHAGSHYIGTVDRRAGDAYFGCVLVGDGCWIGTGSILVDSTVLREGCIVGAGTVVLGEYPSNTIITGIKGDIKRTISSANIN